MYQQRTENTLKSKKRKQSVHFTSIWSAFAFNENAFARSYKVHMQDNIWLKWSSDWMFIRAVKVCACENLWIKNLVQLNFSLHWIEQTNQYLTKWNYYIFL